ALWGTGLEVKSKPRQQVCDQALFARAQGLALAPAKGPERPNLTGRTTLVRQCTHHRHARASGRPVTPWLSLPKALWLLDRPVELGDDNKAKAEARQVSSARIGSTRSSFSQEKPPSLSGWRPK